MFFFFFDDFDRELKEFVIDPKLEARQRKCTQQLEEFRSRFPLVRIPNMEVEEYLDPRGGKDDFCYWITSGTNSVTNRLPWAKQKLGVPTFHSIGKLKPDEQGIYPRREKFRREILVPLNHFIVSRGRESVGEAERCFGQPLLLKLLHLYYPTEFFNFSHVGWIDRVVNARALDYGYSIYERSHAISEFHQELSRRIRSLDSVSFASFLSEYLDLTNSCKQYVDYLIKHDGLADSTAEKHARCLRQFSRLLLGYGIRNNQLFVKIPDVNRGAVFGQLERLADRVELSAEKKDLFRRSYELYVAYSRDVDHSEFRYAIAAHDERRASVAKKDLWRSEKDDNQKNLSDWNAEFGRAQDADAVVDILQRSGSSRLYYRHYTSFSAFLSISDGWMFRLTRGDDPAMNDQLEWKRLGDAELWKRTFIASFSCVKGESAAMWGLYGKPSNEALRLSFKQETMTGWISGLQRGRICPKAQLLSTDDKPGEMVDLKWDDVMVQFGDVLYGGDVGGIPDRDSGYVFRGKGLKKTLFSRFDPKLDKAPAMTGFVKSSDWAYEDEARLIVRLKDAVAMPKGRKLSEVKYVYVPIHESVLMEAEYMLGPCLPVKLSSIVEEKIKGVLPLCGPICKSKYTGNLKFK